MMKYKGIRIIYTSAHFIVLDVMKNKKSPMHY